MDQADSGSFIRVDSLRPIHLMLLKGIGQDYRYAQFQSLLLQGALAVVEFEKSFFPIDGFQDRFVVSEQNILFESIFGTHFLEIAPSAKKKLFFGG